MKELNSPPEVAFATPAGESPHRWRSRDLAFFGSMFLILLVTASVIQTLTFPLVQGATAQILTLLLGTLFFEVMLVGSTVFLVRSVYGLSYFAEMRISRDYSIRTVSLIAMGSALAASVIIVSALVSLAFPGLVPQQPSPMEELLSMPETSTVFAIFGIAVAPALEELLFRGFLFRVLEDILGISVTICTTAALFTVAHGSQLWPDWASMAAIFVVGYVLAKLRATTHSVIPGFIVHTVYNSVIFVIFMIGRVAET